MKGAHLLVGTVVLVPTPAKTYSAFVRSANGLVPIPDGDLETLQLVIRVQTRIRPTSMSAPNPSSTSANNDAESWMSFHSPIIPDSSDPADIAKLGQDPLAAHLLLTDPFLDDQWSCSLGTLFSHTTKSYATGITGIQAAGSQFRSFSPHHHWLRFPISTSPSSKKLFDQAPFWLSRRIYNGFGGEPRWFSIRAAN